MSIKKRIENLILKNPKRAIKLITSLSSSYWEKEAQKMVLLSFQKAAKSIPAYKDFLKKEGLKNPEKICTIEEFQKYVPITDKDNYINQYPIQFRYKSSKSFPFAFSTSGGTGGKPILQAHAKEEFDPLAIKIYLEYLLNLSEKKVLYINAFALGSWYGGMVSTFLGKTVAEDPQYKISLALCGLHPEIIVDMIEKVGKDYELIIISTYPSFFRLILAEIEKRRLNLSDYKIIPLCAGELFTWNFKNLLAKKLNLNLLFEIIDMYAATDVGIAGLSTPFSNLFHELLFYDPTLEKGFRMQQPFSLFQYNPLSVYIEEIDNEIIITRNFNFSQVPVIRYRIKDRGGVRKFDEVARYIKIEKLKERGFSKKLIKWPFVFVKGRTDQAVILLGANIYPEQVKLAIESLEENLINNFKIGIKEKDGNPRFVVYLELLPQISISRVDLGSLTRKYHDVILNNLLKDIDFKDAYQKAPQFLDPLIRIFPLGEGPFKDESKRIKPKNLL
jgi:phenylacetate-CoA ligase